MGIVSPRSLGVSAISLHLHVDDVDAWTNRAVGKGARLLMAPTDQFYGERSSKFVDPFGHEWMLGSSIEEVSPHEMQRRFMAMFGYPSE
jgi:PhnB protein